MAAKIKKQTTSASLLYKDKPKKKRKNIISKTKSSKLKTSKFYKKRYKGQGRGR